MNIAQQHVFTFSSELQCDSLLLPAFPKTKGTDALFVNSLLFLVLILLLLFYLTLKIFLHCAIHNIFAGKQLILDIIWAENCFGNCWISEDILNCSENSLEFMGSLLDRRRWDNWAFVISEPTQNKRAHGKRKHGRRIGYIFNLPCSLLLCLLPPSTKTTPSSLIIVVVLMWRKLGEIYGFTPGKERDVTCAFFIASANASQLDYKYKGGIGMF